MIRCSPGKGKKKGKTERERERGEKIEGTLMNYYVMCG